jgi:uncharacterized protein (TIGR02453 family)
MATSIYDFPPFPGFPEEGLEFLRQLPENNDRDWFEDRRVVYEEKVRFPLKCLVADVARRMKDVDLPLTGHPTRSRFRIYRDLRFTDDPRPYKENVGAVFDRSGEKKAEGAVYVHVEPGASFLASGFYRPSVSYLKPLREKMATNPDAFSRLLDEMERRGLPVTSMDFELTGMPRGFSAYRDQKIASYLKWESFVARRPVGDAELVGTALAETVIEFAQASKPLLKYVWDAEERSPDE